MGFAPNNDISARSPDCGRVTHTFSCSLLASEVSPAAARYYVLPAGVAIWVSAQCLVVWRDSTLFHLRAISETRRHS